MAARPSVLTSDGARRQTLYLCRRAFAHEHSDSILYALTNSERGIASCTHFVRIFPLVTTLLWTPSCASFPAPSSLGRGFHACVVVMKIEAGSRLVSRPLFPRYESVANGRFRDDEFRLGRVIFDFFAQVRDVNAQIMCLLDSFRSPNFSQKLAMR